MTDQATYERRRWIALVLLCVAQFIVVLDASIVNVALPSIGRALDFSQSNLAWVVNAYVLTFGGFLLLGGTLTDTLGWEWVLWVNVPIGIATAAIAPTLIPESRSSAQTRTFDVLGATAVTAGLSLLVYALVDAADAGWGSAQTIGLLAVSGALLAAFVAIELRSPAPLVPFRIFRQRTLTGANVVGLLVGASLFSMFFFISLYTQQVVPVTIAAVSGVTEREAGLASGLINTSQQVGGALGLAVLATIANSRTEDAGGGPKAFTEGFQAAFLGGGAERPAEARA